MSKKVVLLDVDGVVADLVGDLCCEVERDIDEEDITTYDFRECLPPAEVAVFNAAMARPGFCSRLYIYPGAVNFVARLQLTHDVVAVTKPFPGSATWAAERAWWLKAQVNIEKVISTGHKEYVRGDYLVEDSVDNAMKWKAAWPEGRVVLIDRPWNRSAKDLPANIGRVHTWDQAIAAIHGDHRAWR